ncbi:unnamed protein product [Durusdinium trenchii]|uniref:Uncharacterized protein n=1 Tax=Durusdinium trenchii TaxID=1381693 RepID=A0ABP0HHL0_9DINO
MSNCGEQACQIQANPRLREPPERLRRRLGKAQEGVSKPEGIQSSETRSCEPLPGGFKPVPLSRLAAVDQMEAKPPEKPEGEAMGPRPKAKTSQLHVEPVESKYVPPVTIDPKLLWSSCGKALPPKGRS